MGERTLNLLHWGWLAVILAVALSVRACHLDYPALSIDEAESGINAMCILEHGYPTDQYLGLPIFENTLVRRWPGGHPEYEFRDISYSDRGAAVYHGWLPLYAIAGSYWAAGVEPDIAGDPPRVRTTPQEIRRRTVAARVPGIVFGLALVVIAYVAARAMAGRDAGLLAATIAALAPPTVRVAREARYYSAAHALSVACALMIWLMASRGRWRDYVIAALSFALLFHTHAISFVVALIVWLCSLPMAMRRPGAVRKVSAFIAIQALAIIPWALASGFPGEAAAAVPAARELLAFPEDYVAYLLQHWKLTVVLAVATTVLASVYLLRARLPARITEPFVGSRGAIMLLGGWLVIGYITFLMIAPAPSAFLWRLTLAVQGPGIVLIAIILWAAARTVGPRAAAATAVGAGVIMLLLPAVRRPLGAPPQWNQPVYSAIDYLRDQQFPPGTRIYATPLNHLTLTLLSGMPVQSSAPVHARFFQEYDGEIVILESAYRGQEVSEAQVRAAAEAADLTITGDEARDWAWRLATRRLREDLVARGARPDPPLEEVPGFLAPLAAELRDRPPRREDDDGRWDNPAMFRGYETADKWGFWQVFFYRFVGPESRTGPGLNYAGRIQGARAVVLESTWVVFHTSPRPHPEQNDVPAAEEAQRSRPPRAPVAPLSASLPPE